MGTLAEVQLLPLVLLLKVVQRKIEEQEIHVVLGACAAFLGKCFKHGSFVMRRLHQCFCVSSLGIH